MSQDGRSIAVLLGPHRSGTSVGTRLLGELGLRLGDDLVPGHRDNPSGFFEHREVVSFNRAAEAELGVNPFSGTRLLPPAGRWWEQGPCAEAFAGLEGVFERELGGEGLFGFKDPRTVVLWPMYRAVFEKMRVRARPVLMLREPGAVIGSMERRNGLTRGHGELVWAGQMAALVLAMERRPEAVWTYEGWMSDVRGSVERAVAWLGPAAACDVDEGVRRVEAILDPSQTHHRSGEADGLRAGTRRLYELLCGADDEATFASLCDHAAELLSELSPAIEALEGMGRRAAEAVTRRDAAQAAAKAAEAKLNGLSATATGGQRAIDRVEPRPADPYGVDFPDLRGFIEEVGDAGGKLRVCIATEDIVGPIRNGGIGTTYTHLSRLLSEAGHEVTIAYLRGDHCENETMEHWVKWYAEFGVRFVPIDPTQVAVETDAPRWVQPMLALYEFLKAESFDAVHVSEWRGLGMVSMLARKQGLALNDTVFVVKSSSPWLWNREHGYHTVDRMSDLPKMFAEMRSIELGDMVIGGSKHLLRWMLEHGYRMPARAYSQPNVVVPPKLEAVQAMAAERGSKAGSRVPIEEIVFFGRLEYRKGLDVFCDAIDRLLHLGVHVPPITFMGKYGEPIPSWPEYTTSEYIKARSSAWPMKVQSLTNNDTEKAVTYLLSGARLAVMPSVIENSSLAVYEAASFGIPCVASNVGGTPELVIPGHRKLILTDPHPVPLADKLKHAIRHGGFIPKPSFDNDENLAVWLRFHSSLGAFVRVESQRRASAARSLPTATVCLVVQDNHEYLDAVIDRLDPQLEADGVSVVVVDDGNTRLKTATWWERLKAKRGSAWTLIDGAGYGEQHAANEAAAAATGEVLIFIEQGALPARDAVATVRRAAAFSEAAVFGGFFGVASGEELEAGESGKLHASFVGDQTSTYFGRQRLSPLLAVRREAFERLGGFREDHKIPGGVAELFMIAKLSDESLETIPELLATVDGSYKRGRRVFEGAMAYRTARPFVTLGPQCLSRVMLTAAGAPGGVGGGAPGPLSMLDTLARGTAEKLGSTPKLRRLGLSIYTVQNRLYYKLVGLELRIVRGLFKLARRMRR
ncbi:MAG: glycosyltransferase [Planctomycetota bacterium]